MLSCPVLYYAILYCIVLCHTVSYQMILHLYFIGLITSIHYYFHACSFFIFYRRGLIAVSLSLEKMMMAPFREKDKNNDGILSFDDFSRVLVNIGSTLSHEEVLKISLKYRDTQNHENSYLSDFESENTYSDSVRSFRNGALLGKILLDFVLLFLYLFLYFQFFIFFVL